MGGRRVLTFCLVVFVHECMYVCKVCVCMCVPDHKRTRICGSLTCTVLYQLHAQSLIVQGCVDGYYVKTITI